ncbi:MAG: AmmeMemoRadiSam system protein B, partial [Deltaproteobacteria bacterium]|nr:AmmeMemoRadiSam system protein B [Deltaproteobacteria bacterium]
MSDKLPAMRQDLEFIPVEHGGQQWVLIRDPLGLVQEGRAIPIGVYSLLTLLDGTRTLVDLQTLLMRQSGGVLVESDAVKRLLSQLEDISLLDSESFRKARSKIISDFEQKRERPCSHSGRAYPADPQELKARLDEILLSHGPAVAPEGRVRAIVSPHIDLSAGRKGYASAYNTIRGAAPSRVVVLGIGHQMSQGMFCLTEKDFETPLGLVRCERAVVRRLRESSPGIMAGDDFVHRNEHSIEFQVLFLQHLLPQDSFTIVPILCGSLQASLPVYDRQTYCERAAPFLEILRGLLQECGEDALLVAGVDLSHIGLKFGHPLPAFHVETEARDHDGKLLESLCRGECDIFWKESVRVQDR